jgi:hypothetical protein
MDAILSGVTVKLAVFEVLP